MTFYPFLFSSRSTSRFSCPLCRSLGVARKNCSSGQTRFLTRPGRTTRMHVSDMVKNWFENISVVDKFKHFHDLQQNEERRTLGTKQQRILVKVGKEMRAWEKVRCMPTISENKFPATSRVLAGLLTRLTKIGLCVMRRSQATANWASNSVLGSD
ncbi:hypothetical protein L218DRAFT_749976 [Marasmius fiardii PR-910]|nr:hypothetical protein L218DRAFT_749976 [Marasmius fiardii PR-910]